MVSNLTHTALRGVFVGLHHQVGRTEVAVHLMVGDELGVHHHTVADVVAADQLAVGLGVAVELAGHNQLYAKALNQLVSELDGLYKIVTGVYVQKRKRYGRRIERLVCKVRHYNRILAS